MKVGRKDERTRKEGKIKALIVGGRKGRGRTGRGQERREGEG